MSWRFYSKHEMGAMRTKGRRTVRTSPCYACWHISPSFPWRTSFRTPALHCIPFQRMCPMHAAFRDNGSAWKVAQLCGLRPLLFTRVHVVLFGGPGGNSRRTDVRSLRRSGHKRTTLSLLPLHGLPGWFSCGHGCDGAHREEALLTTARVVSDESDSRSR